MADYRNPDCTCKYLDQSCLACWKPVKQHRIGRKRITRKEDNMECTCKCGCDNPAGSIDGCLSCRSGNCAN